MDRRPRIATLLAFFVTVASGCDKKDESPASSEEVASATPSGSSSGRAVRLSSIEIPKAVPAEAAGVMVVRTPESLFAAVAGFDLVGEADAKDIEALREELDEYLDETIGLTLTKVDTVTGFFVPEKGVVGVIEGAKGDPKGTPVGEHEGVTLIGLDGDDVVAAMHDGALIVGQKEAVVVALSAAEGNGKRLRDEGGPLVDLLTDDSRSVTLAAAVAVSRLPSDLRDEADPLGIEYASARYGAKGIEVVATGSESAMKELLAKAETGLTMLAAEAKSQKERTKERGDPMEGVAAIFADHSARRLHKTLVPKLDGDRLVLKVPVRLEDPTLLTAFAGIAAAIAIPALTKYTRRARTSEARVQLAKMFDATAAYFNEEHVERGAVTVLGIGGAISDSAPHKCPNDGSLIGEAGTTPPLSVDCSQGPGGRCVPVAGRPSNPWEYSMDAWLDNDVWNGLNFAQEQGHHFHYNFKWNNADTGYGACQFTAQAFGDLDGDGVFSTFERSGAADEMGVNAAAGLYIDREVE